MTNELAPIKPADSADNDKFETRMVDLGDGTKEPMKFRKDLPPEVVERAKAGATLLYKLAYKRLQNERKNDQRTDTDQK